MILYVAVRRTLVLETEKFDLKSQVYCLSELSFLFKEYLLIYLTASGPSCSTQDLLASCGIFRWRHVASLAVMHRLRHSEACGILVPLPGCQGSYLCSLHLHVDSQPLEVSPGKSPKKRLKFSHLSDIIRLVRGTELQSAASRLSI